MVIPNDDKQITSYTNYENKIVFQRKNQYLEIILILEFIIHYQTS